MRHKSEVTARGFLPRFLCTQIEQEGKCIRSFQGNCAARYHAPAASKYGSSSDFTTASITSGGFGQVDAALLQYINGSIEQCTTDYGVFLPFFLIISASSAD